MVSCKFIFEECLSNPHKYFLSSNIMSADGVYLNTITKITLVILTITLLHLRCSNKLCDQFFLFLDFFFQNLENFLLNPNVTTIV